MILGMLKSFRTRPVLLTCLAFQCLFEAGITIWTVIANGIGAGSQWLLILLACLAMAAPISAVTVLLLVDGAAPQPRFANQEWMWKLSLFGSLLMAAGLVLILLFSGFAAI
jgi:hypothetical protein